MWKALKEILLKKACFHKEGKLLKNPNYIEKDTP